MARKPGTTFRTRVVPGFDTNGTLELFRGSNPWGETPYVTRSRLSGIQMTESEGHPWKNLNGFKGDIGGDFWTQKKYLDPKSKHGLYHVVVLPNPNSVIHGHVSFPGNSVPVTFCLNELDSDRKISTSTYGPTRFPDPLTSSEDDLMEYGTTAISRCKPTNSVANLATALGELRRDGIPAMLGHQTWKERTRPKNLPKNLSGEFLNYQFGIKPLLKDIDDFVGGVVKMDELISQFERDNGRQVRRKYVFDTEETTQESLVATNVLPMGCHRASELFAWPWGECYRRRHVVTERWFSGAFTYTLPSGLDSRTKLGEMRLRANRLGLEPSIETLWNLAPWSWAVDWFANAGDYISNVEQFKRYGLILRYGYIMETVTVSDTYTIRGLTTTNGIPVNLPSTTVVTKTKWRRKANPFGFGVKWDGLSNLQLAIAAALGINRVA